MAQFADKELNLYLLWQDIGCSVVIYFYSFVNRGNQNYCGYQVVMCSGKEEVSVSGYEI